MAQSPQSQSSQSHPPHSRQSNLPSNPFFHRSKPRDSSRPSIFGPSSHSYSHSGPPRPGSSLFRLPRMPKPTPLPELIATYRQLGILKFGDFTLSSGQKSTIYLDLRKLYGHPRLLDDLAVQLINISAAVQSDDFKEPEQICGVAYAGIPMATLVSQRLSTPLLVLRKEKKEHGTAQLMEGVWQPGQEVVLIDDVITSGGSLAKAVTQLQEAGLKVSEIIVFMDRRSSPKQTQALPAVLEDIPIHSVCTLKQVLELAEAKPVLTSNERRLAAGGCWGGPPIDLPKFLQSIPTQPESPFSQPVQLPSHPPAKKARLITDDHKEKFHRVLEEIPSLPGKRQPDLRTPRSLEDRRPFLIHSMARQLVDLMIQKRTNLCLSADVTSAQELLTLVDQCGPYICLLKLHWDIIIDANHETIEALQALEKKHRFLILEDRKLADIGNTVKHQIHDGPAQFSKWVHALTAHSLPGPGLLEAFDPKFYPNDRVGNPLGVFLLAEMSSDRNLVTLAYTKETIKMARQYPQTVAGLVAQQQVADLTLLILTPGAKLPEHLSQDQLGQCYRTPDDIFRTGTDVMIVGRGIVQAGNPKEACRAYRRAGWLAYLKAFSTSHLTDAQLLKMSGYREEPEVTN